MIFGVIFAVLPFLGFPSLWHNIKLIALGVLTVAVAYTFPGPIETPDTNRSTYTDFKAPENVINTPEQVQEIVKVPEVIINSDNSSNQ